MRAWQPPTPDVRVLEVAVSEGELAMTLQLGAFDRVKILLTEFPPDKRDQRGDPLNSLMWLCDPHEPSPIWIEPLRNLRAYVLSLDHGQFREVPKLAPVPPPPLLVPLTWALLATSVLALLFALGLAMRELGDLTVWMPLVFGAWLLRAVLPHRLVMVYFGFLHVDQAVDLHQLPRYGPATTLLDHALFAVLPAHHATVQHMHTVLAALTILPLAALVQRLATPWAARAFGVGLALLPVAWLDSGSESMLVPAMLWWSTGTLLLSFGCETRRVMMLSGAVVLLALAGLARPDCLMMTMPTALCVVLARPSPRAAWFWAPAVICALVLLWLPDIAFLRDRAHEDVLAGNLPRLNLQFVGQVPRQLAHDWLILDYRYWPLPLTALALAGFLFRETRRPVAALWLASVLWATPMLLDFNETSKLRLHLPSGLLVLMAAAVALGALQQRQRRWLPILLLVTLGSFALTAPQTMAPQLSDRSENVLAAAASIARDGRKTALVVRSYDDDDTPGVHLFWPQYLLEPGDRWLSVRDWRAGALRPDERALGVIDVRCHAGVEVLPNNDPRIPETLLPHPSCQTLWRAAIGQPLWQEQTPNIGERGFAWYPPPNQLPTLTQAVLAL